MSVMRNVDPRRLLRFCITVPTLWALLVLQLLVMPPELWAEEDCKMACGIDERTCCCRLMAKATGRAPRHQDAGSPALEILWRICPIPEVALGGSSVSFAGLHPRGETLRLPAGHDPAVRRGDRVVLAERPDLGLLPRPPPAFPSST